jgi:hypothetical protein
LSQIGPHRTFEASFKGIEQVVTGWLTPAFDYMARLPNTSNIHDLRRPENAVQHPQAEQIPSQRFTLNREWTNS